MSDLFHNLVPELPHHCNSWVVVQKGTNISVCEIFNRKIAEKINFKKYEILSTLDYLNKLNVDIRNNERYTQHRS